MASELRTDPPIQAAGCDGYARERVGVYIVPGEVS